MNENTPSDRLPAEPRRPILPLPADFTPRREPPADYVMGEYPDGETVDLREVLGVLRRHALLIGLAGALLAGLAAVFVYTRPEIYRASAIVRLKDVRGAMTQGIGDAPNLQGMLLGRTADPLLSELEILKSPAVATAVVAEQALRFSPAATLPRSLFSGVQVAPDAPADTLVARFSDSTATVTPGSGPAVTVAYGTPIRVGGVGFTLAARPPVSEARIVVLSDAEATRAFLEKLEATPRDQTDVVDVRYDDYDPAFAQAVVNSTVHTYQRLNTDMAQDQSRRRRTFVEEQLAATDAQLARAQLALSEFRRREKVYSSGEKFATEQTTLMGLDVRREELDAERRMYESLLARVRGASDTGTSLRALISAPGIAQNPMIAELSQRLARVQVSLDSMTTGPLASSEANPDVRRMRALVASTRADLISAVDGHVQSVRARIAALDQLKSRTTSNIEALPTAEAEEVRLTLQVETIKKIADQLREEFQKARVAEVVEAGQVEVLSLAALPDEPVPSHRPLKVALALVVGLLLGSGGAFLREHLDSAIGRREDIDQYLRIPTLGVVPRIGAARPRLAVPPRLLGRSHRDGLPSVRVERLVTAMPQNSSGAEAYRSLRTNLLFSQVLQSLRTVMVTSASPSEGKSTTVANLAIAFAQQGMRVLLVDCDLRRPAIHRMFQIPSAPGLVDLALHRAPAAEVVRQSGVEGLWVLTAGTLPPSPSEFLGSDRMRELLRSLGAGFDIVLLDSPPVLAASDAAVLATHVDGTLLVVRAGETERGAAALALQHLENVSARIVGAVLNDPDAKIPGYGGYYDYSSYGYNDQEASAAGVR